MNWDNMHDDYSFSPPEPRDEKKYDGVAEADTETLVVKIAPKSSLEKLHAEVSAIPCSLLFFAPLFSFRKVAHTDTHVLAKRAVLAPFFSRFEQLAPALLVPHMLWSFRRLLQSMHLLGQHGMYCASYDNIGFKNHVPYIRDFSYVCEQRDHRSLEAEFLCFLRDQPKEYVVVRDDIMRVCRSFLAGRGADTISEPLDACGKLLQKAQRWPRDKALAWLEGFGEKACVFSLSSLYVHLIEELSIYDVPEPFLALLTEGISYAPASRPTMVEAMRAIHTIM